MTLYVRSSAVLDQPDIRLFDFPSIAEAVQSDYLEFAADEPALVLSFAGQMFELNLVAAVLWEALGTEQDVNIQRRC